MPHSTNSSRLARCCLRHPDWETLAAHLIDAFDGVSAVDVVREVEAARRAVHETGLGPPDDLFIAELIARNQLLIVTGAVPDAARLDPQQHLRSGRASA